jgi:hypothetical protein
MPHATPRAVPTVVVALDLLPVVSPRAALVDVQPESARVVGDGAGRHAEASGDVNPWKPFLDKSHHGLPALAVDEPLPPAPRPDVAPLDRSVPGASAKAEPLPTFRGAVTRLVEAADLVPVVMRPPPIHNCIYPR